MFRVKKKSDWSFDSSTTGGLTAGFFGVGGGVIDLNPPKGNSIRYNYYSMGGGLGFGAKIPFQLGVAPGGAPNSGSIYILSSFHGTELTPDDFKGACQVLELSVNVSIGGNFSALLVGMNPASANEDVAVDLVRLGTIFGGNPTAVDVMDEVGAMQTSAKAVLIMGGFDVEMQIGGGAMLKFGYIW